MTQPPSFATERPSSADQAPSAARRAALLLPLALGLGGTDRPRAAEAATLPADVGRKFNADGSVRPFAGNTFIGPVPQQGAGFATFDALLTIYREFPAHAFSTKIALLPPSSYHVTLFGGLNESDRNSPRWPQGISGALALQTATTQWLDKLAERHPQATGFDFVLDEPPPPMRDGSPHIPLRPADEATAKRLADLREALARLTGIRRADHDRYQYHLTFGYVHHILTPDEALDLQAATARWMAALPPVLHVPAFHFCRFKDMYAFESLHQL
jgi:hypothetical protein